MIADASLADFFTSDDPDLVRRAAGNVTSASSGRVATPEQVNARTSKPERGGLCCAVIFGPIEDHLCACGQLRDAEHAGQICDKCGVLCGDRRVREQRWGHIAL